MAEDLISAGADVDIADTAGQTALHAACRVGDEKIARIILHKTTNIQVKDFRFHTESLFFK